MATTVAYMRRKRLGKGQIMVSTNNRRPTNSAPTMRHCQHQVSGCVKCQIVSMMCKSHTEPAGFRSRPPTSKRKPATTDGQIGAYVNNLSCPVRGDEMMMQCGVYRQIPGSACSIQSHRSRVFARREERFPALENRYKANAVHQNNVAAGRLSEPLKQIQDVNHKARAPNISAPQPAGKSTSHLPILSQHLRTGDNNTAQPQKRSTTRNTTDRHREEVSPSRLHGSHIAGVSSKDHTTQATRSEKMASGWAEVRAGLTIPNLRDSQDDDKTPRDRAKDASPGRSTKDFTEHRSDVNNHGAGKESQTTKKSSIADVDSTNSTTNKAPYKKTSSVTRKPVTVTYKSKLSSGYKSKLSSGYGSMSSGSQNGDNADNKYSSAQRLAAGSDGAGGSAKVKEIASIYKSKVPVEETRPVVVGVEAPEEHVLTEKETEMYSHLKQTYNKSTAQERQVRKDKFFRKLQDVQLDAALEHNRQVAERAARKEKAKKRQLEQLGHIRKKFEEERIKRFKSQYVSKNFEDYDRQNRTEYGLPEHYMSRTEYQAKLKGKGGVKITALAFIRREVKMKKSYSKMFVEPVPGQNMKDPKMEGKDQITLQTFDESGNPKKGKKVNVKSELKEAENMIKSLTSDNGNDDRMLESPQRDPVIRTTTITKQVPNPAKKTQPQKDPAGYQKATNMTNAREQANRLKYGSDSPQEERAAKDERYADALSKWNQPELKFYQSKETTEDKIIPAETNTTLPENRQNQGATQTKTVTTTSLKTRPVLKMPGKPTSKPQAAKSQPAKPQPAKPQPAKAQPAKAQPAKAQPSPSSQSSGSKNPPASTKPPAKNPTAQQTNTIKPASNIKPTTEIKKPAAKPPPSVFDQPSSTGAILNKPSDAVSMHSRISVITEESETDVDFYESLMAKYGIELSDSEDDEE